MGQKLSIDDPAAENSETGKLNLNPEDSLTISILEKSDLRDDDSETENIEDLKSGTLNDKANDTINLQEDVTLNFNGFISFDEGNERGKEDYKTLLRSESPSLENLLSDQKLDLSFNEEIENLSPPAPQEDSKNLKEKIERISRIDSNKKPGIITRSKSTSRYNDGPSVGHDDVSKKEPLKEK